MSKTPIDWSAVVEVTYLSEIAVAESSKNATIMQSQAATIILRKTK